MYSFPNLGPVHCSMSSSNCCLLTCIQISQEAGQVVWYSHLLKNFPQFVLWKTEQVQGFSVIHEAEVDVLWNFLAFSMIEQMLAIWSLVPLPFLNPACTLEILGSHTANKKWWLGKGLYLGGPHNDLVCFTMSASFLLCVSHSIESDSLRPHGL